MAVRCILTAAAQEFITPLSAGALAGERAFTDLFDAASEFDVGHIRLARDADAIVVAPATADLMAKMAGGHADDLASAVLLATNRPILIAPAMNPAMWAHGATQRNLAQLVADGVVTIGPNAGEMAERGEAGVGRMAEPPEIAAATEALSGEVGRAAARRQARRRDLGTDARADRSGALHRQSLVRPAGPRHRGRRRCGRRRGDARFRAGQHSRSARRQDREGRERARHVRGSGDARCRPTARYSRPRLRTGASRRPGARRSRSRRARRRRRWRWSRTRTFWPPSRIARRNARPSSSASRPRPRT